MPKTRRILLIFVLTLAAINVSAPAERAGFKRFQLDSGDGWQLWRVSYVGNAYMGSTKVEKALHCKTAKLANKEGYRFLALSGVAQDEWVGGTYTQARGTPNYWGGYSASGTSVVISGHEARGLALFLKEEELITVVTKAGEKEGYRYRFWDAKEQPKKWRCKGAR